MGQMICAMGSIQLEGINFEEMEVPFGGTNELRARTILGSSQVSALHPYIRPNEKSGLLKRVERAGMAQFWKCTHCNATALGSGPDMKGPQAQAVLSQFPAAQNSRHARG